MLGFAFVGTGLSQTKIPACPAGSQSVKAKDEGRPYIRYECKLPQKANNMDMCWQWEGTHWTTDRTTTCGSRVSTAVEYTGTLKCPVTEQIYLWDGTTKALSKNISCLPTGWESILMTGRSCPQGYVGGSPTLFGQDNCYGPRTASRSIASTRHDLLAHDINGFTLDMTVERVKAVADRPLHPIGGGQAKVTVDDIEYDLGFSVLGHLYRIDSEQNLGNFVPDQVYASSLAKKMSAKFGPPNSNQLPDGPLTWGFSERYREADGAVMNRDTVSLSAMLTGGYGQPIVLHLKLMDFRIMRRDLAKANAAPRSSAVNKTKF
jgi:hypothetical protein